MKAQELKSQLSSELLTKDGVSGIGIGEDEDGNEVVVVNVESGKAHTVAIPEEYQGEGIEVRETGPFYSEVARTGEPQNIDRKSKHRPVPCGVSAGHVNITAGTAGFIMEDGSGNRYPSSNNHVYADVNEASEGDAIVQPGPQDGGTSSDQSGTLAGSIPLENGATVDFAWIDSGVKHTLELAGVGTPKGDIAEVSVGDTLIKSGRTTGVTTGTVEQVSADLNVGYGNTTYQIKDSILTSNMSQGGDSGSAVLKENTNQPVGVLFAGSSSATLHSKASNVEAESGLTIVTEDTPDVPTASVQITLTKKAEESGNISVNVSDESGSSISGAEVSITGASEQVGTTNSEGVVNFNGVPIGDYTVSASKSGYTSSSTEVKKGNFV